MKNNILKLALLAFAFLIYTLPAMAEPDLPPDDEDPPAPIDNWVLLLILAGVALGLYFLMKYRRKGIA